MDGLLEQLRTVIFKGQQLKSDRLREPEQRDDGSDEVRVVNERDFNSMEKWKVTDVSEKTVSIHSCRSGNEEKSPVTMSNLKFRIPLKTDYNNLTR